MPKTFTLFLGVVGLATALGTSSAAANPGQSNDPIARGRYLVVIAGCNDCHTAGYTQAEGKIPEKDWLTGDRLGWSGPWGTTYATNLRLYADKLSEQGWMITTRSAKMRPPMPFWSLQEMSDEDLRAIFRFIKSLGPAGKPAPAFVPPGQTPKGPVVTFPAPPAKK